MSLDHDHLGDYAPAPKKRGRISRSRKALIVTMAIGAFAATSGAGTFASFTASTDNPGGATGDTNPFATPDFELANTVLSRSDGSGPTTACLSSDDTKDFPAEAAQIANVDGDNAAYCSALFLFDDFATTATANLKLENTGEQDGDLLVYAVDIDSVTGGVQTCFFDQTGGATNDLCQEWGLQIQEYSDGGELLGNATPDFEDNAKRSNECVIPAAGAFCGTSETKFNVLPQLASATNTGDLFFDDDGPGDDVLNNDVRYFKVTAKLPPDAGCTDTTPADGYHDTTGIGCYNSKSNGAAQIQVRWVLRG